MKNFCRKILFLLTGMFLLLNFATVSAESEVLGRISDNEFHDNWEVQLEYLSGMAFSSRNVNNYNVHIFHKAKDNGVFSISYGGTFTRAVGATNPRQEGIWKDSNGVGIGPAGLLRWRKQVSGKFYAAWDFSGSFMFYNRAHPAEGRAYGFLWRTGPRFIWQSSENSSVSLGYSVSHFSNAMKSHNPGYNTLGFSLGFNFKF